MQLADALWTDLERMLAELVPEVGRRGIALVKHPDERPLPMFASMWSGTRSHERKLFLRRMSSTA